jgi:membrane protease YdiL (CAAX protease family)
MRAVPTAARLVWPLLLVVAFGAAVAVRVAVGGAAVARSSGAGLAFAGCLLALAVAARVRVPVSLRAAALGLGGALVLTLPVLVAGGWRPLHAGAGFDSWAPVVVVVAVAEELFLRGALHDAVAGAAGPFAAVAVGAVAFALLHVPLYGWSVLPLDLVVGALLGELRRLSGTPLAPALTHALADLAAWFLR